MRCPWQAVFDMPALEFLNVLAYRIDRNAKEKRDVELYKLTHN